MERWAQLEAQDWRCFYCERGFGAKVWRGSNFIELRVEWDHMVPYSFNQNNGASNFVAACRVCNALKSDRMFQSVDAAKVYLNAAWKEKGYEEL